MMASPKINSISWGHIVPSNLPEGKDYKLWPGGGRAWDWGETGTRHKPGIQTTDVEELLEKGATEVVLSQGMEMMLGVPDATRQWLEAKGVKVHIAETKKAVEIFNQKADEGVKVGGLFHSTC